METRIRRVEGFMGTPPEPLKTTIFQALEKIDTLQKLVNKIPSFIEGRIVSMGEDLGILTDVVDLKIDVINTELSVLKRAIGDRLVDFRVVGGPDSEKKKSKDGGKDKGKTGKYGKDGKSKFKKAKDVASGSKPKESQPEIDRSRKGCFICGGDHRKRDFPKRSKLNALMAEDDDSGKDVGRSQVNPLQLLSTIQEKSTNHKGLMYVKIIVNGKVVMTMIDTGATHNFVAEQEIQKLSLNVLEHSSRIKAVNLEAKQIKGMATVDLVIGSWHGQCKLIAIPLDDFDIILGMQFLISANGVFPSDDPGPSNNKNGCLSAMQVKKGLKYGEMTYLATMVEIKKDVFQEEVPDAIAALLVEFEDIFPSKIPKKFPLRRAIDHKIELEPRARPLAMAPYRMNPTELVELRRQLDEFWMLTDASDRAIGGVLVHDKHPIALEIRKLKDAEMRYSTNEKEMTGVIHCLDAWKHYLLGTKFTVADKHNDVADALSRKAVEEYVAALTLIESDFLERIRESSQNDAGYLKLVEQVGVGHIRKYWLNDGLSYAKDGRAYMPSGPLRRQLLRETHDPQWVGHPGIDRMLALLSHRYYWPKMEYDVEAYVRTCLMCQLDKSEHKKETGLLQPLPIPERPWQSVSMDFILGFPKVNRMASIFVVVDRFSKYGVFIPAPNACLAETAADLSFKHVAKYFELPEDIISDRDTRFTGRFWTALFNMMGTELKFSTAYHPQTDGQMEQINQLLEEYLRHYVSASQKNWVELLDMAQFCYNLLKSSATGISPFELVYGLQPMTHHEIVAKRTGGKSPAAYRFARAKQELLDEAKDSLSKAQRRMTKYANLGRRDVEFSVGENVLLKLTPQIWKKISSKTVHRGLIPKYDGPFEILKKVGNVAYRLRLPDKLRIHPTIHVSFLKKYHKDALKETRKQAARALPLIRQEFDKDVQRILSHCTKGQSKKNRKTYYLVHWKGESEEDATWERDVTLWQFEKKIDELAKFLGRMLDSGLSYSAIGKKDSTVCGQDREMARRVSEESVRGRKAITKQLSNVCETCAAVMS
ncbi:hypothetical protein BUALT_Bualt17G0085400 [Buddleja alternifolia]|uniref:Reverse transcriptase n=1 Tax=Buddleja alternifolia TaxID=168488 RepID=A0AAV6WHP4_9LAMI|nr:hypothetical protein BUALT_Bualt17G0085400 [Buddleja alternifolia]